MKEGENVKALILNSYALAGSAFHAVDRGSNPLGDAKNFKGLHVLFAYGTHWITSAALQIAS